MYFNGDTLVLIGYRTLIINTTILITKVCLLIMRKYDTILMTLLSLTNCFVMSNLYISISSKNARISKW